MRSWTTTLQKGRILIRETNTHLKHQNNIAYKLPSLEYTLATTPLAESVAIALGFVGPSTPVFVHAITLTIWLIGIIGDPLTVA